MSSEKYLPKQPSIKTVGGNETKSSLSALKAIAKAYRDRRLNPTISARKTK